MPQAIAITKTQCIVHGGRRNVKTEGEREGGKVRDGADIDILIFRYIVL